MPPTPLWAGHESESWQTATAIAVNTSSANFDSNYSRCAAIIGTTPVRWGPSSFGNLSELWLRMRAAEYFGASSNPNVGVINFMTSGGQVILRLYATGNPATVQLQYWNGSSYTNIGSSVAISTALSNSFVDVACKIHSTDGWFAWWVNGTKQYELVGNTDFFSATIDQVSIAGWNQFNSSAISEIVAADLETVGMRVATLALTGAGATNTFASGVYTDVNGSSVNDATFLQSDTAGQLATFTLSDLSASAQLLTPLSVHVNMRARNSAVVPQNLEPAVRTGGTDYFGSAVPGLNTSFWNGFGYVWNLNPDTAAPWDASEINAAEAGARSAT